MSVGLIRGAGGDMRRLIFGLLFVITASSHAGDGVSLSQDLSDFGSLLRSHEERSRFEQQLQQLRDDAKLQDERDRLDRERQKKLEAQRRADGAAAAQQQAIQLPAAPNLDKAPKWADIEGKPEFQAMDVAKQAEVKAAYFDYWIAPRAGSDVAEQRARFLAPKPLLTEPQWHLVYACAGALALLVLVWKRHAVVRGGGYVVQNGFRIAALMVALSMLVLVVRGVGWQTPVVFIRGLSSGW